MFNFREMSDHLSLYKLENKYEIMLDKNVKIANREDFLDGTLGDRMKFFEKQSRIFLKPDIGDALVMRFDGRSFSTFTQGYIKPIDDVLVECMTQAMSAVAQEIQGAFIAYTQSDEITVICKPKTHDMEQLVFEGNIQKLCSIYASTVSTVFNLTMLKHRNDDKLNTKYYKGSIPKLAQFDARAWLLPKEELINSIIWRQQDCERNSISGMAQSLYSHKLLHGKDQTKMLEMILTSGQNWHTMPIHLKHGMFTFKESYTKKDEFGQPAIRNRWVLDFNAPKLTEDKDYFEDKLKNIG